MQSGAIVEYLIDTYDKEERLTYTSSPEKYQLKSWLHFQMSGQGPYYGQSTHFQRHHPTLAAPIKLPTAIERYQKEAKRVVGVLNGHLTKHGTGYLVGDKLTYADLAFVPWNDLLPKNVVPGWDTATEAPAYTEWHAKMMERESVKNAWAKRAALVKWFQDNNKTI